MDKSKKVIAEQGGIPRFFVRILCDMEEHVRESLFDKEKFKKLSPSNGRALKRLKLTLNKYTKPYAGIMAEYRENPVLSSADEAQDSKVSSDSEAESNSDSDSSSKSVAKAGSSSSSSKSSSSSSSSSSSESDDNESSSEVSAKSGHSKAHYDVIHSFRAEFLVSDTRGQMTTLSK